MITPGTYKHSKTGKMHQVHFLALDEATKEKVVVYESLYDNDLSKYWVRTLAEFEGMVEIDGIEVPRFVRIETNA